MTTARTLLARCLALAALVLAAAPALAGPDDGEIWICKINACAPK